VSQQDIFKDEIEQDFDHYINNMRKLGSWASFTEIQALSSLLQVAATVHSPTGRTELNSHLQHKVHISYHFLNHYNALQAPKHILLYPQAARGAVALTTREMKILKSSSAFINDTIIDFYFLYLHQEILNEDEVLLFFPVNIYFFFFFCFCFFFFFFFFAFSFMLTRFISLLADFLHY
jgi:hypothetical protein